MFRSVLAICGMALACGGLSLLEGLAGALQASHGKLRVLADAGERGAARFLALSRHAAWLALGLRVCWLVLALALFGYTVERFDSTSAALAVFAAAAALTVAGLLLGRSKRAAGLFVPEERMGKAEEAEREIRLLMDGDDEEPGIDEAEKAMIRNIFEFDNKTVDDVAVHRKDVVMLAVTAPRDDILQTMLNERFSRIPVYEGNIDNIIGILHIKDLFRHLIADGGDINLRALIRKPYFVPLTKKTDELFDEMRRHKAHMAVVVDEYGGTAGLVTMEDLIEEIMGNIYDEDDEEDAPAITHIYAVAYAVDGRAPLDEVAARFNAHLPVDEYDTVSGYIIGNLGRIPATGERPAFVDGGLLFQAQRVEDNRVVAAILCDLREEAAEHAPDGKNG